MNSVPVSESNAERMERLRVEFAILHALGLHLYPVGKDKMPLGKWVHGAVNYVQTQASLADAQEWSKSSAVTGWAVLCGNKDLRVFCLDVEAAGMAVPEIADLLGKIPDCYKRRSTSGGMHAWFRITEGEPVHTHRIAWNDGQLLAEVRGVSESDHAGAYAVVTGPGRGPLQPDFRLFDASRKEVDHLLDLISDAGDGVSPKRERQAKAPKAITAPHAGGETGTGDVICRAVADGSLSWPDVLDSGWTVTANWGGRLSLLRPAYGEQSSSTESGNVQDQVLVIHSESVPWAKTGKGYNAAQAFTEANYRGDYAAAMTAVERAATGEGCVHTSTWPKSVLDTVRAAKEASLADWKEAESRKSKVTVADHLGTSTAATALALVRNEPEPESETEPVSSWAVTDLGPILDGSYQPEEPSIAERTDGRCLFYAGRTHSIFGESGSGKSLVMQAIAVSVMGQGMDVLYLDFESDAGSIVGRLRSLGAKDSELRERFHYVRPDAPLGSMLDWETYRSVISRPYALAILDGVTEAMSLVMPDGRSTPEEGAAKFDRLLPARIAQWTGAAVVSIDHVVKSADNRGRYQIGSVHKQNGLTGAAYLVQSIQVVGRGRRGVVEMRVTSKDRPGGIKPYSGPVGAYGMQSSALIEFDSDGERTTFAIRPPEMGPGGPFRPTTLMGKVSATLEADGELTQSALCANVSGKKASVLDALAVLTAEGYVSTKAGPRGSKVYRLERAYDATRDPQSDTFRPELGTELGAVLQEQVRNAIAEQNSGNTD